MMEDDKFRIFQAVMSNFLREEVPDNFREVSLETQKEFIVDNYWEPYADWDYGYFMDHINNIVSSVRRVV